MLLKWVDALVAKGLCDKTAPKLRAMLLNPIKVKLLEIELTVVVVKGKSLKAGGTALEGDTFEFITGYATVMQMGEDLKGGITADLRTELQKIATPNGMPTGPFTAQPTATVATATVAANTKEILHSLSSTDFKSLNVSVGSTLWEWPGDGVAPQPRYKGKPTSWVDEKDKTTIRIKFEKGRDDNGNEQEGFAQTKAFSLDVLLDPKHAFSIDPFDDGRPAPTGSAVPIAPPLLLGSTDFTRMDVIEARAGAIIAPAIKYFKEAMEGKRGGQLARMKAVRFFDPLYANANLVTEADIDGLSLLRLSKHPKVAPAIVKMKEEITSYNALVKSIKPFEQRKDAKGKDTFDRAAWWRSDEIATKTPAFKFVLRAVLANSPNSIPPERVFSVLNNTFDEDQESGLEDYKELSLQLQFNERSRKKEAGSSA